MNGNKIFVGEDFALIGRLVPEATDEAISIDDYELRIELSTTALGQRIVCASNDESADVPVFKRGADGFVLNVGHEWTARLTPGELIVSLMLIHKETKVRMINEQKLIRVMEARIN